MACVSSSCIFVSIFLFKHAMYELIHYSYVDCFCSWGYLPFNPFDKATPGWGEQLACKIQIEWQNQSITFVFQSGVNEMELTLTEASHTDTVKTSLKSECWAESGLLWGHPLLGMFRWPPQLFMLTCFLYLLSSLQCNNDYAPVCGSNNQNYQNECFLRRDACKQQSEVLIMSEGACPAGMYIYVTAPTFTHSQTHTHTCTTTPLQDTFAQRENTEEGYAHWTLPAHSSVSVQMIHSKCKARTIEM